MTKYPNPFTPSFGEVPARLAGRQTILATFDRAFSSTGRAPEHTSLITGARGTGKTTMLSVIAQEATRYGWICVEVTAAQGMLDDIVLRANKAASHLIEQSSNMHLSSTGIPDVLSVKFQQSDLAENWRMKVENILDQLDKTNTGLLITIDEIDPELDELKQLVMVYQHFVRENRRIALIMAGLPRNVSSLLSEKSVTFLRRAHLASLEPLGNDEVRDAVAKTIATGGRTIEDKSLNKAVEAIGGFPYLLQLVGYRMWDINPENKAISSNDVEIGISVATEEMERQVLQATYRDLSDGDIAFLKAMLCDQGDSKTADIAERLQVSTSQVAQYRRRLIDAGIVGERRRGVIGFDLPFFRNYLEKQLN